jgi:signal transduction histidine kinase
MADEPEQNDKAVPDSNDVRSAVLSANSNRLLQLRDVVLHNWERKVRARVKGATEVARPILINTLPSLYGNLAESLTPDFPRRTATDSNTIAGEHGGERARLTSYDPTAIIQEYQLLREALLEVVHAEGFSLNEGELLALNAGIDNAIRESVNAFSLVYTALREQFIAAITHDLRNPLAAANAAAELISHGVDPEKTRELADKILKHLGRMDRMLQDLLDTMVFQGGARTSLRLSHFDIAEVVSEVCEAAIAAHGARIHMLGISVMGWWSRDAIKRALENLVGNAIKYGAPGGAVTISIDECNERLLLSVHNEGEPVPPEQMESVFQIFRRARAAQEGKEQGWGIGLPYVRTVAESHGGSIGADSSRERGTTFILDVPVDARPFQNSPTLGLNP